ncbi:helix-turn-helix transcriptional regulator [Streptomyces sp. NPDC001941]|uniref:helix-turn-helix domain-containing protein n=1 Tax=Streptomyces sp. NPDC001941 TaxID=3154659 RepID=UPI00332EE336
MPEPGGALPRPAAHRGGAAHVLPLRDLGRAAGCPSALKVITGRKLRDLRDASGLPTSRVCRQLGFSQAKLNRIELGRQGCKVPDARALLALYGVTDRDLVEEFVRLVEESLRPEYFQRWNDSVAEFFHPLLALEYAADQIRVYEPNYVPGLLQTPAYAAAVIRSEWPLRPQWDVERLVELRMARQEQFRAQADRAANPRLWVAVREEALLWSVEDKAVLHEQLGRLIDAAWGGQVPVQVVSPRTMARVPITQNITYLRFSAAELDDAVYTEQASSSIFLQDRARVEHHLQLLDRLAAVTRTPEQSLKWLQEQQRRLEDGG